jgi:hypothetical protein
VAELEEKVKSGEIDASFHLAQGLHRSAMTNLSLADLRRAEDLLAHADHKGHEEAMKWLVSSWPLLNAAANRRIARGSAV